MSEGGSKAPSRSWQIRRCRRAVVARHITTCPPRFLDFAACLHQQVTKNQKSNCFYFYCCCHNEKRPEWFFFRIATTPKNRSKEIWYFAFGLNQRHFFSSKFDIADICVRLSQISKHVWITILRFQEEVVKNVHAAEKNLVTLPKTLAFKLWWLSCYSRKTKIEIFTTSSWKFWNDIYTSF